MAVPGLAEVLRAPWVDQASPATNVGQGLSSLLQPHAPQEVQGMLRLLSYLQPPTYLPTPLPTFPPPSACPQIFSTCCSTERTVGHMDVLVKYLEPVSRVVKLMRINCSL